MAARPTLRSMIGQLDHQTVQLKQRLSSLRRRKNSFSLPKVEQLFLEQISTLNINNFDNVREVERLQQQQQLSNNNPK